MKSGVGTWALGLTVSALLHLGAGAGLLAALQPEPFADQPVPETRLNIEAQEVPRSTAQEKAPDPATGDAASPRGTSLDAGAVAQSVAPALPPPVASVTETNQAVQTAAVSAPPAPKLAAIETAQTTAPALELPSSATAQNTIVPVPSAPKTPQATALPAAAPQPISAVTAAPNPDLVPQSVPAPTPAAQQAPPSQTSPQMQPDVATSKAVLAFPTSGTIDPKSLAAFQSFTQPDAATGTAVRDGLAAALSLPCSRMQVIFDPDTTTLKLTGHVPDPAQRGPVLAALQAQMGSDIVVADNLLVLPAPQCGALTGIAEVGLPQSTDQITNPLIVGTDTHARIFPFVDGDPLAIDMVAPDYPAYVYVDYFDASGNVIHLAPNDRTPLQRAEPKSALKIGARSEDELGYLIRIGPPYGEEIAAAFAASMPLYEGVRPVVEPAAPYLAWLKERVSLARAQNPEFKGEWVYFFVTTSAD